MINLKRTTVTTLIFLIMLALPVISCKIQTAEDRIMQIVINDYTNRELSYVLEHRTFSNNQTLLGQISNFKEILNSYCVENDPQNQGVVASLVETFLKRNAENSKIVLHSSVNPEYAVDYSGELYDSDSQLNFIFVGNPVIDRKTGYVIASLEYSVRDKSQIESGLLYLFKYQGLSLKPLAGVDGITCFGEPSS